MIKQTVKKITKTGEVSQMDEITTEWSTSDDYFDYVQINMIAKNQQALDEYPSEFLDSIKDDGSVH